MNYQTCLVKDPDETPTIYFLISFMKKRLYCDEQTMYASTAFLTGWYAESSRVKLVQSFSKICQAHSQKDSAVSARCPVCVTRFFDEFRLFDVTANRLQVFYMSRWRQQTADWSSRPVPAWCVQRLKYTGHPLVTIHQENTSTTPGTMVENYFRFTSATVENGLNGLG